MKTIYTAIIGPYDELKEPKVITPGWKYLCFTDQDLTSDVWEIIKVPVMDCGPIRTARYYKIMFHKHIENEFSIWIDASFTINCNLDEWWSKHFKGPFTCVQHPIRDCVYEEADVCIKNKRGIDEEIYRQATAYIKTGLPAHNGLIGSGILMRQRSNVFVELFCEDWYKELMQFSTRDQLSFAFIAWIYERLLTIHTFKWDYRTGQEFQWLTHIHRRKNPQPHDHRKSY